MNPSGWSGATQKRPEPRMHDEVVMEFCGLRQKSVGDWTIDEVDQAERANAAYLRNFLSRRAALTER